MKKKIYLIPLILALFIFTLGLIIYTLPSLKDYAYLGLPLMSTATLIILSTAIVKIIASRRNFKFGIRIALKIIVTLLSFILFTVGLGLLLVAKMIVLGIVLAAIGLLSIIFLVPMFIAFVRANPFEHIIITPNYDDIDTEFFIDKDR